jgi:uncharacterized protein (DUF608 family)
VSGTYSKRELAGTGRQRTFTADHLHEISFPLGGLGAGCLHVGGRGNFQDFLLFHEPDFGHSPMTFAAVHTRSADRRTDAGVTRVLEGPVGAPQIFNRARFGSGLLDSGHEGLPHMESAQFTGEFPFARVRFKDRELPLTARLEAWSPFVPGDAEASGLPAAIAVYTLKNSSRTAQHVQFSFHAQYPRQRQDLTGHTVRHRQDDGAAGLWMDSALPTDDVERTSIAVVSPRSGQQADCAWFRGGWWDALTMLSNQLLAGKLKHAAESKPVTVGQRARLGGSLFWDLDLAPGESVEIPIIYCWHVPNSSLRQGRLEDQHPGTASTGRPDMARTYRPWYGTCFADAWDVAQHVLAQYSELQRRTRAFHRAWFRHTSLPDYVIDAVSANLAILKSPTLLRQEDGMLWCWEGCSTCNGCCFGSCDHVWNYAQAIPHLFPELERTLRDQELYWSMDRRGHCTFRSALPTGKTYHTHHAAADGQLCGIMKVYRDWQINGDDAWMKQRYPLLRRSLEYGIRTWDPKQQGVLVEPQHNTYDIEFWGPNAMLTSFYIGALAAAALMADHLGHATDAARWNDLATRGRRFCDRRLWNGEYYIQRVQVGRLKAARRLKSSLQGASEEALALFDKEGPKYQYGSGCLTDGVLGAWHTQLYGLPPALTPSKARRHLRAIFKYNFRQSLQGHANPQRPGYALNDEPGTLLCSWPKGGKPQIPFVYSDEVWTGIEYQVASHMILAGLVDEGLSVTRAVRLRYDGRARNPWNEYECGSYYARALAAYALLPALSGISYSKVTGILQITPRTGKHSGRFFFSADGAWGTVAYNRSSSKTTVHIRLQEGTLDLAKIVVGGDAALRRRTLRVTNQIARAGRTFKAEIP